MNETDFLAYHQTAGLGGHLAEIAGRGVIYSAIGRVMHGFHTGFHPRRFCWWSYSHLW